MEQIQGRNVLTSKTKNSVITRIISNLLTRSSNLLLLLFVLRRMNQLLYELWSRVIARLRRILRNLLIKSGNLLLLVFVLCQMKEICFWLNTNTDLKRRGDIIIWCFASSLLIKSSSLLLLVFVLRQMNQLCVWLNTDFKRLKRIYCGGVLLWAR